MNQVKRKTSKLILSKGEVVSQISAFNKWRRGESKVMPNPRDVGLALDRAVELLKSNRKQ